jgi:hypothetical protein
MARSRRLLLLCFPTLAWQAESPQVPRKQPPLSKPVSTLRGKHFARLTAAQDRGPSFAQGGHLIRTGYPTRCRICISCSGCILATLAEETIFAVNTGVSRRILVSRAGCCGQQWAKDCELREGRWRGELGCEHWQAGRSVAAASPITLLYCIISCMQCGIVVTSCKFATDWPYHKPQTHCKGRKHHPR